jgi:SOUL heme-binding protein
MGRMFLLLVSVAAVWGCWVPFTAAFVSSIPNHPYGQPNALVGIRTAFGSSSSSLVVKTTSRILPAADATTTDDDLSMMSLSLSNSGNKNREAQELLLDALAFNASAAVALLEQLRTLSAKESAALLGDMLRSGPDAPLPFWTRFRFLARISKRARYASLKRTLTVFTPPPASSSSSDSTTTPEQQQQQQRARALVALLRSLASLDEVEEPNSKMTQSRRRRRTPVSICVLEQKARQASRETSADVLRQRLPPGLETPRYEVVATLDSALEIRLYQPYSVCAVSMTRPRPTNTEATDAKIQLPQLSGASSFGALAGYLFGKNDQATAMKMTTPVFTTTTTATTTSSSAVDQQMEFVLPSDYWQQETMSQAPQPLPGSGVMLQQIKSETRAVVLFGGYASQTEVTRKKAQLKTALQRNREWTMVSDDMDLFALAQYNDPFTVPWRRLNEVSVPVIPLSTEATASSSI